jgi:hypothetical protein
LAAPKGTRPPGGSRKGKPNKVTKALKEMILAALDQVGGQDYLAERASKNPTAFLALIGRVLPTTLTGDGAQPITVVIRRFGEEG